MQAIWHNFVSSGMQLSVSMDTFWASPTKKLATAVTSINYPKTDQPEDCNCKYNGCWPWKKISCMSISQRNISSVSLLDVDLEDADVRMIPHVLHAVNNGSTKIVLLSNDTDVMELALCYWDILKAHGLQELWRWAGMGNTIRYIPYYVYTFANYVPTPFSVSV